MREKTNPDRDLRKRSVKMSYLGILGAALFMILLNLFIPGCTKDEVKVSPEPDPLKAAGIVALAPANLADSVAVNPIITVTFKSGTSKTEISASSITLKQGTTVIPGTLTHTENSVTFTTEADLSPDKQYAATVKTSIKGSTDSDNEKEYSWKFKTGRHHLDEGLSVLSVIPLNSAKDVSVTFQPVATFNKEVSSSMKKSTTFVLHQGTTRIEGSVTFSGNTATFKPATSLIANANYTGKINIQTTGHDNHSSNHYYVWSFTTTGGGADVTAPSVASVLPASNTTSVPVSNSLTAVFNEAMNPSTINSTTFILKKGTTAVAGTIGYSGNTATFNPSVSLAVNSTYSATITTGVKDIAGNAIASNYSWNFTTAGASDVTAPTVLSVVPSNSATSVAVNTKATITFSEAMDASTITSSTVSLKQGSASIPGTVSYSGSAATFTPAANLSNSTAYTVTVTTGAKDVAGNAIASNFTSGFTTAAAVDVTPPSVQSTVPANNATSIAVNSKVTATFSEPMGATTITSSSFTLKQGTTSVTGTVAYSGTTATFTPAAVLAGNTVYTATISTAAKDVAGNALVSSYSWSFTTVVTAPAGLSFASDVVPALNACNTCHVHGWTTSTVASTFYANLVSSGYVNAASSTTSKIYIKISGGHPSSTQTADMTKILTWMREGSKNN